METACLLANLDLVVTVDTPVAHLAGAVGVPVWVPLAAIPDWRWLFGREDRPWYPTLRLFRQEELGNWQPVLKRMARALHAVAEKRERSGDGPPGCAMVRGQL
jgi:hypothetical protein